MAGIRELKNNLSRYLRALRPGDVIAITDRGRVVAELRVPGEARGSGATSRLTGSYARLVAEGVIRPAAEPGDPLGGFDAERVRPAPKGTAAALIREDRGD